MKRFTLLSLLGIINACSIKNNISSSLVNPNYVVWNEAKKLDLTDFKAIVKPLDAKGINMAACCATSIYMESQKNFRLIWDGKINNVKIISFFDCGRSWFDKNYLYNNILEHEQIHFDITELIARRLRKEVYFKPLSLKVLQAKYNKSLEDLNKIQTKFDSDTNHGILHNRQIEWNRHIQEELSSLSQYANR
jgi:hypothetical protein